MSNRYSKGKPTSGIRAPPSSGPAIAPALITVMFSELAAGSWSTGISAGNTAVRVGWLTAKQACCRA